MEFTGRVKWFNIQKGYGFIEREGQNDLFVHRTGVVRDGNTRELQEGDTVSYEITEGKRGPIATNVHLVVE
ncbi:MAG: cold shock domain-containing protein [Bacteroidales bacterium]|nr:cold shock domain-containing protein [Bacteroidales bacterium]